MSRWKAALLTLFLLLTGCGTNTVEDVTMGSNTYQQITQEEAKNMMELPDVIILDVREQSEFDTEHIPNAVLFPVGTITAETAAAAIPQKDSIILVYCRSGNRSKTASETLCNLGYTQVYEFGGIITWPYEVE